MPSSVEFLSPVVPTISGKILKVKDWPVADRAPWTSASFVGGDLLDLKLTPSWRDSSRELFERCYGGWLQWLVETGTPERNRYTSYARDQGKRRGLPS